MTRRLTGWETTRLSKHFILLDFLADHAVYRRSLPLRFDEVWNVEHECLARDLCNELLEPLMADYGPISVADAFWPRKVADRWPNDHRGSRHGKHRWEDGEATTDVALYKQVDIFRTQADSGKRKLARKLKKAVDGLSAIDDCRGRVLCYPNTEFLCVTFKFEGAEKCGGYVEKNQTLRAHHIGLAAGSICLISAAVAGRWKKEETWFRSSTSARRGTISRLTKKKSPDHLPLRWIRWWMSLAEYRLFAEWRQPDSPLMNMPICISGTNPDLGGRLLCCHRRRTRTGRARFWRAARMFGMCNYHPMRQIRGSWRWSWTRRNMANTADYG